MKRAAARPRTRVDMPRTWTDAPPVAVGVAEVAVAKVAVAAVAVVTLAAVEAELEDEVSSAVVLVLTHGTVVLVERVVCAIVPLAQLLVEVIVVVVLALGLGVGIKLDIMAGTSEAILGEAETRD